MRRGRRDAAPTAVGVRSPPGPDHRTRAWSIDDVLGVVDVDDEDVHPCRSRAAPDVIFETRGDGPTVGDASEGIDAGQPLEPFLALSEREVHGDPVLDHHAERPEDDPREPGLRPFDCPLQVVQGAALRVQKDGGVKADASVVIRGGDGRLHAATTSISMRLDEAWTGQGHP